MKQFTHRHLGLVAAAVVLSTVGLSGTAQAQTVEDFVGTASCETHGNGTQIRFDPHVVDVRAHATAPASAALGDAVALSDIHVELHQIDAAAGLGPSDLVIDAAATLSPNGTADLGRATNNPWSLVFDRGSGVTTAIGDAGDTMSVNLQQIVLTVQGASDGPRTIVCDLDPPQAGTSNLADVLLHSPFDTCYPVFCEGPFESAGLGDG